MSKAWFISCSNAVINAELAIMLRARQRRRQSRVLEQGGGAWAVFWGEGGHGERVEREPITAVWGQSPQRGPAAEPLVVRGSGGELS